MSSYAQLFTAFYDSTKNLNTANRLAKGVKYTNTNPANAAAAKAELTKYFAAADEKGNNDGYLQASEISKAMGISERAAQRLITTIVDDYDVSIHVTAELFVEKYAPKGLDADHNGIIDKSEKEKVLQRCAYYNNSRADNNAREMMSLPSDQRRALDIRYGSDDLYLDDDDDFDGLTKDEAVESAKKYLGEAAKLNGDSDTKLSAAELARVTGLSAGAVKYLTEKYADQDLDLTNIDDAAKVLVALDEQDGLDGVIGSDRKKWLEQKAADAGYENTYATATPQTETESGGLLGSLTNLLGLGGSSGSGGSGDKLKGLLTIGGIFLIGKALFGSKRA